MRFRDPAFIAFSFLAIAATLSAPLLIPLDAGVLDWIQRYGACRALVVAKWLDGGARAILVLVFAGLLVARRPSASRIALGAGLVAGGAAFGELLKTGIERLRPRSLPETIAGNSLPSGHVMNTTILALVAWSLVRDAGWSTRRRTLVGALLAAAVAAQVGSRLLRASHWPSDIGPSILCGIVWMLGAELFLRRRPFRLRRAATVFVALYAAFYALPILRIHVRSALDRPRLVLAAFDVAEGSDHRVHLIAASSTARAPTMDGRSADTRHVMQTNLWTPGIAPTVLEAVLHAPCGLRDAPCPHAHVVLNGWRSADMELGCGSRWYRVQPPPGVLRAGENHIAVVTARSGCREDVPARVVVRSLALVAGDERGGPS